MTQPQLVLGCCVVLIGPSSACHRFRAHILCPLNQDAAQAIPNSAVTAQGRFPLVKQPDIFYWDQDFIISYEFKLAFFDNFIDISETSYRKPLGT